MAQLFEQQVMLYLSYATETAPQHITHKTDSSGSAEVPSKAAVPHSTFAPHLSLPLKAVCGNTPSGDTTA